MKKHPKIDALLQQLGASILKRYGQNFLVDESIQQRIVSAGHIQPGDVVLEIGPGLGALTQHLPFETIQYISYEIDQQYHRYLSQEYQRNTRHYRENFLKAKTENVNVIFGNLPYYITTDCLEKIFKDFSMARTGVFLVQKEVLDRLVAQPNTPSYGPLALFMQFLGTLDVLEDVQPESFYPEPHVMSTVFKVTFHHLYEEIPSRDFFYFVKKLFLNRRKNIVNNLGFLSLDKDEIKSVLQTLKIAHDTRPEQLALNQIIKLYKHVQGHFHL